MVEWYVTMNVINNIFIITAKFNDVTRVGLLAMCHLNEPDTKVLT